MIRSRDMSTWWTSWWENKTNPENTDKYIEKIEGNIQLWGLEWIPPTDKDITFSHYKSGTYTINREGVVKSLSWEPMKYVLRDAKTPYVVIRRSCKDKKTWEIKDKYKEIPIIQLMDKYFEKHIIWYKTKRANPQKEFLLVPKDNDWSTLAWNNLYYVDKKEYNKIGTKGLQVEHYLRYGDATISDQALAEKFHLHRSWVNKVRKRLLAEKKIKNPLPKALQKLGKISFEVLPIYIALLESEGQKSNMEIAIEVLNLDRDTLSENEKKKETEKVRRVRERLVKKWVIERYKTPWAKVTIDEVREELIEELENKVQSWKTYKEIAEILGLNIYQVNNFSRKWKKSKERVKKKLADIRELREKKSKR